MSDSKKYVIIGAGIAGISAAEELLRLDPAGNITIISDEDFYYRAALSEYFQGKIDRDEVFAKPDGWFESVGIRFLRGTVTSIDTRAKTIVSDDSASLPYDSLLIASGASAIAMAWPGIDLNGVCTYRGLGCIDTFLREIEAGAKKAVVIGGGILSFELIDNFLHLGLEVTLLVRGDRLLGLLFDEDGAKIIEDQLYAKGVEVRFNTEAESFEGADGKVTGLTTKAGDTIPCDLIAPAIGIRANVGFLEGSGIEVDRSVIVDRFLRTSVEDVYAAGDCCAVRAVPDDRPVPTRTWLTSALQGAAAAVNMTRADRPFSEGVTLNSSSVFDSFYAVLGVFNPPEGSGHIFRSWKFEDGSYMRWTIDKDRLAGAIIIDAMKYVWPVRQLIESRVDVTGLLESDLENIDLLALVPRGHQVLFKENHRFIERMSMHEKQELTGSFIMAPVPVVLVACAHEELGRNLLTIAWCGIDCSDPETVHVSIRPERHSYRMISESQCFTVNLPTVEMTETVDLCGVISGSEGDKFERAGLTAAPAKIVKAPIVAECPVNIECEVRNVIPVGVHHMFIGEVVAKHADEGVMKNGKLDFSTIPLITYVNGEYWSLGKPVGRYGFSKNA